MRCVCVSAAPSGGSEHHDTIDDRTSGVHAPPCESKPSCASALCEGMSAPSQRHESQGSQRQSQGLLDPVWDEESGRRVACGYPGQCALLHLIRSGDNWFRTLPLLPSEARAFPPSSALGPVVSGFLVWRKSVFYVYLPMLLVAIALSVLQIYIQYGVPINTYLSRYYGDAWATLSAAADELHGPYYIALSRDIILCLASFVSSIWLGLALLSWDSFLLSARRLRTGFLFVFVAPFLTTAILSTNDAVNWDSVIHAICVEKFATQLENLLPLEDTSSAEIQRKLTNVGQEACDSVSSLKNQAQTQARILTLLEGNGLLANSTAGGYCAPPPGGAGPAPWDQPRQARRLRAGHVTWEGHVTRGAPAGRQLQTRLRDEYPTRDASSSRDDGSADHFKALLAAAAGGDETARQQIAASGASFQQLSAAAGTGNTNAQAVLETP